MIKEAIATVVRGENLSEKETEMAMDEIQEDSQARESVGNGPDIVVVRRLPKDGSVLGPVTRMPLGREVPLQPFACGDYARMIQCQATGPQCPDAIGSHGAVGIVSFSTEAVGPGDAGLVLEGIVWAEV